jgi:hypothetical protein
MATTVSFNGTNYSIPQVGERLWGVNVRNFLIAVAGNALSKNGGSFTLTQEVNFGSSFGLVSKYFKSVSSNISTTGVLRLANNEGIGWRNAANNADQILKLDAGNRLELDGVDIPTISSTDTFTNKSISGATNTLSAIPASSLASTTGSGAVVLASGATLTSPAITTPTGIVKGDVGLGNVDNTSDATKNAASVSLTNKTLVTPVIDDYLELNEESAPSTPSSGKVRVYAKTDKKIYTKDSAGTESQVGSSGSGELNLVENPSDSNNWSETGTVFSTPVTTTTAGDLPLGGLTDTAIQLVASGNGAEASHYNSYSFTTPASLSGKMKVEFYQRPGTGFAESEWTVSVYQSTTRQSLSTDSSGVTYLVNASNKRTVYVDLLASTAYTLRFARVAGSGSATLNISNVIVGPGIQAQSAVVGEWQSYTPTLNTNGPAISSATGRWRRVGDSIDVQVKMEFTGTGSDSAILGIKLPNNLTVDTTKLPSQTAIDDSRNQNYTTSGYFYDASASAGDRIKDIVQGGPNAATGYLSVQYSGQTAEQVNLLNNVPASGDTLTVGYTNLPIAEWAGSGTVNLAQNDVEYAYNTGNVTAANGTDTSSFGYGPNGTPILAYNSTTGSFNETKFTVRFQTPIQATDDITLEFLSSAANSKWQDVTRSGMSKLVAGAGAFVYGAGLSPGSAPNEVLVVFGNGGQNQGGAAYNTAGDAWSSLSFGWRWRVRKSSAGAAVGFGKATSVSTGLVAPRKGQYSLTVTGTGWTTTRAVGIYYQDQDGVPRFKFNLKGTMASSSRTGVTLTFSGVTFKNGYEQAGAGNTNNGLPIGVQMQSNASTCVLNHASQTTDYYIVAGDVELESIPTWA